MTTNGSGRYSARVHQAQGMVAAQAICSMDQAIALMKDTAAATEMTLEHVAKEVLGRRARFDRPT